MNVSTLKRKRVGITIKVSNHGVTMNVSTLKVLMVFKTKNLKIGAIKARDILDSELTRIALKSMNRGKYYEQLGNSSHTQFFKRKL